MGRVMTALSRAGLAYVDDTGLARGQARAAGVPYARASVLIEPAEDDVPAALSRLSARAATGEVALAKLYASPEALRALAGWAERLPEGQVLVPASSAVAAR